MKESGIDWIGQIPEEWEVAKVNHIFEEKIEVIKKKIYYL